MVRGDGSLRYFNGYVFEFQLVRTDGGYAFYRMVLKPWMAYLKLRKDNFVFHERSLREQTELVFADYSTHANWDARIAGEDPKITMACQFGESDHNYLSRRWEAAGWYYWYEHSATGHRLVLANDSTAAPPIDGATPEIRFQKHGGAAEEEAIGAWSPVRQIVAGQAVLTSFDFKQPVPATVDTPSVVDQGAVLHVETYEYAGAYGFRGWNDGNAKSELRMKEIESRCKHVEAEDNNRYALPGRWFTLTDHFGAGAAHGGDEHDKTTFLILSVRHSAANNYLQGKDAAPDYHNTMLCTRKSVPWRPGRGFDSVDTRILGPQTATVVGPPGQEIHTDDHGRVKVQFHWGRVGANDDRSSAFVRVASSWASGQYGAVSLPRAGDEVIVNWLDANPDLPIITGRVYNGSNISPWELPSQGALSGIRSRELKGGNGAGNRSNHLLMDDTNDQIQAVLSSDRQHSQLNLGYLTRGDRKFGHRGLDSQSALHEHSWSLSKPIVFVTAPAGVATSTPQSIVHAAGEDLGNYAVGHLDLTAGKILSLSAAQGVRQHVERGGHATVVSHGDYHVHVQDGQTGLVSQKGITIEARSGDITLKTKGGSIVLTEAGEILIKGAKETHEIAGTLELGAAQVVNSGSVPVAPSKPFWGEMNVGKFSQQIVLADALHKIGGKAAHYGYKIVGKDGAVLKRGKLDAEGKSERVFTEDMEELHAEIDMHDSKWQIAQDERHPIERAGQAADALSTPVGVAVLADKAQIPVDTARGLFRVDGGIDVGSIAMSVFQSRLNLPAAAIVELLRPRDTGERIAAVKDAAVAGAGAHVIDGVHEQINHASARLVAALEGELRPDAPVPEKVRTLFAEAEARREQVAEEPESDGAEEVVIEENDDMAALSLSDAFAVDLDELPAEMRGHDGNAIA